MAGPSLYGAVALALTVLAFAAAPGGQGVPASSTVGIEQAVAPAKASDISVSQLPSGLPPPANGGEDRLRSETPPPATLTAEVIAAWNAIRGRGQTPTPDLIAREIGPGKLAEFLATGPAAASVLATGHEPGPHQTEGRGEEANGAIAKTLVPAGGN